MKKQLVIIGNGSAAVECYWLAKRIIESGADMEFKGFISYEGYKGRLGELAPLQLGMDDDYEIQDNDVFCIGIGFSELRLKAFRKWKKKGATFVNMIHPKCEFIGGSRLGEGNIFMNDVFVSSSCAIGDANYFSPNVLISHDVAIGDCNFFYPHSIMLEFCGIDSNNQLGVHSIMLPKTHMGSGNIVEAESILDGNFGNDDRIGGKPAVVTGPAKADQVLQLWEKTTRESEIYRKYNEYLRFAENSSREEIEHRLTRLIEENLDKNLDRAMLFYNEYELEFGSDSAYCGLMEKELEKKYNARLSRADRFTCKLRDPGIENANYAMEHFKNLHRGERAFIIGNGPSLNMLDLGKLKNEYTFGVNSIFLNFDKMGFQPTYYVVEDTHVIRERAPQIAGIDKSIKFIPQYGRRLIPPDQNSVYFHCIPDFRRYEGFPLFGVDAARRVWSGGTVSYVNLQLALYMGFSEVYLIGFDHHYVVPDSANVNNFDIVSTQDDPNHFHPDYFGRGLSWHVPLVNRMELAYMKAKYVYDKKRTGIFNATAGGDLEVFTRVDYDSLFRG